MNFYKSILHLINKPFPYEESRWDTLNVIVVVSLFVTFFLYIFKPFDMDQMDSGGFLICLKFGIITFIVSILFEVFSVLSRFKSGNSRFTFGRWVLYMIGVILCISVANYIFVRIVMFGYITWEFLPFMIRGTFAIGIFPIIGIGMLAMFRQERKYQRIANEMNQSHSKDRPLSHFQDCLVFDIPVANIKYVEALQNYVRIGYLDDAERLIEQTERTTLKQLLEDSGDSCLVQCHRSYLVNRDAILSTSGNAQGLLLTLSDCDKIIPVSRSLVSEFRDNYS